MKKKMLFCLCIECYLYKSKIDNFKMKMFKFIKVKFCLESVFFLQYVVVIDLI